MNMLGSIDHLFHHCENVWTILSKHGPDFMELREFTADGLKDAMKNVNVGVICTSIMA